MADNQITHSLFKQICKKGDKAMTYSDNDTFLDILKAINSHLGEVEELDIDIGDIIDLSKIKDGINLKITELQNRIQERGT